MKRIDFNYVFAVRNSNPNGDPDNNNEPRVNPINWKGLISDVCLKGKSKLYVAITQAGKPGFDIYCKRSIILEDVIQDTLTSKGVAELKKNKKFTDGDIKVFTDKFFDVRTFGSVVTFPGISGGDIRGAIQLGIAESIDLVDANSITITRCCAAKKKEDENETGKMGTKHVVPFAYYQVTGSVCAVTAEKNGLTDEDVEVFFDSLLYMWEYDKTAARGNIYPKSLVLFEHDSHLKNCHSHRLHRNVKVVKKEGVDIPTSDDDYTIVITDPNVDGVTMVTKFLDDATVAMSVSA
jgi:CRISPR-associated protein Csd2